MKFRKKMDKEKKTKILVTLVVSAMLMIYVGSLMAIGHMNEMDSVSLDRCIKEMAAYSSQGFDLCWRTTKGTIPIPIVEFFIPFVPALLLLWFNWFANPSLQIPENSYPRKTMKVLLFLGLLCIGFAVYFPISDVVGRNFDDLNNIPPRSFFLPTYITAMFIFPVILFHHILGEKELVSRQIKIAKSALVLGAFIPLVIFAILVVRQSVLNA